MSFDIISVRFVDNNMDLVEYGIACSCKPSNVSAGDKTDYDTVFNHVDGVFIGYDPEGDVVFYDVAKKIMRLWITDDDGEECIIDLNGETWFEYNEVLNNLNLLFNDHWPSLGEIAGVLSLSRF